MVISPLVADELSPHVTRPTPIPELPTTPGVPKTRAASAAAPDGIGDYPGFGWPWQALADCESGFRNRWGNIIPLSARWAIENPPYSGGLQFKLSTWQMAGGERFAPRPSQATPEEQIEIAQGWLLRTSWAQWPACSRKLGLR